MTSRGIRRRRGQGGQQSQKGWRPQKMARLKNSEERVKGEAPKEHPTHLPEGQNPKNKNEKKGGPGGGGTWGETKKRPTQETSA